MLRYFKQKITLIISYPLANGVNNSCNWRPFTQMIKKICHYNKVPPWKPFNIKIDSTVLCPNHLNGISVSLKNVWKIKDSITKIDAR